MNDHIFYTNSQDQQQQVREWFDELKVAERATRAVRGTYWLVRCQPFAGKIADMEAVRMAALQVAKFEVRVRLGYVSARGEAMFVVEVGKDRKPLSDGDGQAMASRYASRMSGAYVASLAFRGVLDGLRQLVQWTTEVLPFDENQLEVLRHLQTVGEAQSIRDHALNVGVPKTALRGARLADLKADVADAGSPWESLSVETKRGVLIRPVVDPSIPKGEKGHKTWWIDRCPPIWTTAAGRDLLDVLLPRAGAHQAA